MLKRFLVFIEVKYERKTLEFPKEYILYTLYFTGICHHRLVSHCLHLNNNRVAYFVDCEKLLLCLSVSVPYIYLNLIQTQCHTSKQDPRFGFRMDHFGQFGVGYVLKNEWTDRLSTYVKLERFTH